MKLVECAITSDLQKCAQVAQCKTPHRGWGMFLFVLLNFNPFLESHKSCHDIFVPHKWLLNLYKDFKVT
jgi:hypothetical protein